MTDDVWYPVDWPCCACGQPVLDGHLTCGRVECDERKARDESKAATLQTQHTPSDDGAADTSE